MLPFSLPTGVALRFAASGEEALDVLTDAERDRLRSFRHSDRQSGFVLGRMAARSLLAERLGCAPAEAPLALADGGAPVVNGHPLWVSISHAGQGAGVLAAAAVASVPVGLDLERITPRRIDLYRRILHETEWPLLDELPLDHDEAQTLLWSLKEAVLKGLGTGFRRPARSIRLSGITGDEARADAGESQWALRYARRGRYWVTLALHESGAAPDVEAAPER